MGSSLDWILIKIVDYGYRVFRRVLHYVLALAYWSCGETVSPVNDPILKMSATKLAKHIREGKLTSEAVVRAFTRRILEVEPLINAIAERRFEDALREARDVDALVASGSVTRQQMANNKPLLGVPFTAKAIFTVKDLPCNAGSLLLKGSRGHEDAPTVALMKEAGAILLATTNLPEMAMGVESTNYVYGTTCNPYNTSRTSGGSTGGEGALLSAAGSVIGLGNDQGGSIRMPSMFCGIFGHKPTRGLVPNGGSMVSVAKHMLCTGPMCRYAEDLVTTMKVLTSKDKKIGNFEREVSFDGMKVFYINSLGHVPLVDKPNKDIRNAIKKVVSHFETKFGAKSQLLTIPLLKRVNMIWAHALLSSVENFADNLTMGKAKVNEILELLKFVFRRSIYTFQLVVMMNFKNIPLIYNPNKVELYKNMEEELNDQFSSLLDDKSILVMPTLPFSACYHGEMSVSAANLCYCSVCNITGMPSTQCPVGFNDKGLPVGVQIIGKKGNDILTIACAIELEKAFGGWLPPK